LLQGLLATNDLSLASAAAYAHLEQTSGDPAIRSRLGRHDDGQHVEGLDEADVVLVGVSRTSKTPTSIYLANRGIRTANVPLVPGIPLPHQLEHLTKPLVVSLHASEKKVIGL
jgi:regulator of PEP synthase PpsR (kinase-PPPase family)